jgi:hypothetical protein
MGLICCDVLSVFESCGRVKVGVLGFTGGRQPTREEGFVDGFSRLCHLIVVELGLHNSSVQGSTSKREGDGAGAPQHSVEAMNSPILEASRPQPPTYPAEIIHPCLLATPSLLSLPSFLVAGRSSYRRLGYLTSPR